MVALSDLRRVCAQLWHFASPSVHSSLSVFASCQRGKRSLAVPADQYLVTASSSGDKLVVSSLKSSPVAVVELADGVSVRSALLCHCVCIVKVHSANTIVM